MQSTSTDTMAPARRFASAIRLGLVALVSLVGAGIGASGCLDRPLCDKDCRPRTTNIFVDTVTQKNVDKIDLLFMVDNSISMADKQAVLKDAVPDLVNRLVNPYCVNSTTQARGPDAANPDADCPAGFEREFTPIRNIHIGVISSSIGGHGATLCKGADGAGLKAEEENDHAWLIGSRPRYTAASHPMQIDPKLGFLNWNPKDQPGENLGAFIQTFQDMTVATGEFGCGFEASLEAIYRFLADPSPPKQIVAQQCAGLPAGTLCAVPDGKDDFLLAQRAQFLRADSLLAVIMLSDENDCSIQERGQYYYPARNEIKMPQGSAQCGTDPNGKCCYTCGAAPPSGCDDGCANLPPPAITALNLRCYKQKQRFGLDFLYPTMRYVNALSQPEICPGIIDLDPSKCPDANGDGSADLVPNPLFQDLQQTGVPPRDASLVFLAGIVGVPWQDLAKDATNQSELKYKTAKDIASENVWDTILGDPTASPPRDPIDTHMMESTDPRPGIPGTSGGLMADPINGHEWANTDRTDLEYACIFKLPGTPRDCAQIATEPEPQRGCDCKTVTPGDNNPLCQQPDGSYGTNQAYAKAYPGIRELQTLKDFGNNSIIASICARNLTDNSKQDYGYRPAVDAIVDRLKEALTGKCLPRVLTKDKNGKIPCSIIEANPAKAPCDPAKGRQNLTNAALVQPSQLRLKQAGLCDVAGRPNCIDFQLCEVAPAAPNSGCNTTKSVDANVTPGWCYVDPDHNPGDNPDLVATCDSNQRRILRFIGAETPAHGATVLIACFGAQLDPDNISTNPTSTGTPPPPPADAATGG